MQNKKCLAVHDTSQEDHRKHNLMYPPVGALPANVPHVVPEKKLKWLLQRRSETLEYVKSRHC